MVDILKYAASLRRSKIPRLPRKPSAKSGPHYLRHDEFLQRSLSFWFGHTGTGTDPAPAPSLA